MEVLNEASIDEPVQSYDIILAPINQLSSINRLQFHTREGSKMHNCTAKFKKNVKHLQLINQKDFVEQEVGYHDYFHDDDNDDFSGEQIKYEGEGFSQYGFINNAIGFIKNGKLYLLPVHETYDMQHLMKDKVVEEQPIVDESIIEPVPVTKAVPIHAKFGKKESESKKKRREQSSLHKQKLIEQDPWIPLDVEKRLPTDLIKDFDFQSVKSEEKKIKTEN